jgi:hypothetical protein
MEAFTMDGIEKLRQEIEVAKQQIASLGDMRPGSLSKQSRSWGNGYWQLSYTHKGCGHTRYVSEADYEKVKAQTESFKSFKSLCAKLGDLSVKLAEMMDKEGGSK